MWATVCRNDVGSRGDARLIEGVVEQKGLVTEVSGYTYRATLMYQVELITCVSTRDGWDQRMAELTFALMEACCCDEG